MVTSILSDLFYYVIWEWEISQARKKAELEEWEDFLERYSLSPQNTSILRKPLTCDKADQRQPDQNSSSPE